MDVGAQEHQHQPGKEGFGLQEGLLDKKCDLSQEEEQGPGVMDVMRDPGVRKNCFISGMIYFVCCYVHWGSIFGVQALKGNIYFNSLIGSCADLAGGLLTAPALHMFKRRTAFFSMFTVTVIGSLGFLVIVIPPECLANSGEYCW